MDPGNLNDLMNDESDLFFGHSHLISYYLGTCIIYQPAKPCLLSYVSLDTQEVLHI